MRLVKHIETDPAPRGRLQPKTETRAAPEADPAPSAERRLQPIPQAPRSPEFMERAMNAHGASVYRLALNQTRSPHDAEDVSQDVFLRLLRDKTDFVDDGHLKPKRTPRRQAPKRRTTALRVIRLCRHPKGRRASWTATSKTARPLTPSVPLRLFSMQSLRAGSRRAAREAAG